MSQQVSFEVLDLCGKFYVGVNESKTVEFSTKISKPALLVMVRFLKPAYIFSNQTLSIQKQDIAILSCKLLLLAYLSSKVSFTIKLVFTYSTIFGCFMPLSSEISLIAVEGTPSSSFSSLIFFKATNSPVTKSLHL